MAEYGSDITESEAHEYVERCKLYKDSLINGILGPHLNGPPGDLKNCAMYYSARTNAWIFDADLVKQLLDDSNAKYFAVFLGATDGMDSIAVLAGLTNEFMATAVNPKEHPGLGVHSKFPNGDNGPIDVIGL